MSPIDIKDDIVFQILQSLVEKNELVEADFQKAYKYSCHNGLHEAIDDLLKKYCKCYD